MLRFPLMRRLQSALLIVLLLLMPFRAIAAMSMEHAPAALQGETVHAHDCCDQQDGDSSVPCAEHDCCATFIATAAAVPLPALAGTLPIQIGVQLTAGFVPEHLDPPPLAL